MFQMILVPGDPGAIATTKVGGVPWWPQGIPRPKCIEDHLMSFVAQVRVDEIPEFDQPPTLLSFHYCDECTLAGKMPWGWSDKGHQLRYQVRLFTNLDEMVDGEDMVVESQAAPHSVDLLSLPELRALEEGRSKLGGQPDWWQESETPEDENGEPMRFVGQLGLMDFPKNSWSTGSAYLFVSDFDPNETQQADMVIQTT